MAEKIKVLIVDDNKQYRDAFRRNLQLKDYEVCEADNADEALQVLQTDTPDVVVTDLQMRTRTEGLDLIKQIQLHSPLLPTIMISAVGTFEEGALASQLGATHVISKSRIEDEIYYLYETINTVYVDYTKNKERMDTVNACREKTEDLENCRNELRAILDDPDASPFVKSEAYDTLIHIEMYDRKKMSDEGLLQPEDEAKESLAAIEETLTQEVPSYPSLDKESKEALRSAEFFFSQHSDNAIPMDLSRNIGFSYCFAVENEAKARLRKRLVRFLADKGIYPNIRALIDSKTGNLDLFFHQYLLRLQHGKELEFTVDNVKQTFQRILEHGSRYKPDGLKALGIIMICFGRSYDVRTLKKAVRFDNPLGIKGLKSETEILDFAESLVSLQHYRNPYIHPEISEMKKVSKIRETAIRCLNFIARLK